MNEFARLLLDGGDHLGMAMPRGRHGDAGREVKKLVAVHVGNDNPAAALGHQRIRAGVGRRDIFLIGFEHALGVGSGQGSLYLGTDCGGHGLGGHGILRKAVASGQ